MSTKLVSCVQGPKTKKENIADPGYHFLVIIDFILYDFKYHIRFQTNKEAR